jgi:hypothetical protein
MPVPIRGQSNAVWQAAEHHEPVPPQAPTPEGHSLPTGQGMLTWMQTFPSAGRAGLA